MENDDYLRQTIAGTWVKSKMEKGAMLMELPEGVLLALNPVSNQIIFGIKDKDGYYQYAGDISFTKEFDRNESPMTMHVFSPSIASVEEDKSSVANKTLGFYLGIDLITKREFFNR